MIAGNGRYSKKNINTMKLFPGMAFDIVEIKRLRREHNLTQLQLARGCNVSQSLIAKIEAGSIDPSYSKAKQILDYLYSLAEKSQHMAKDVLVRKVIWVKPGDSVHSAIQLMKKHGISQLPVRQNSNPVGLVTEASVLKAATSGQNIRELRVEDVMLDSPPVVNKNTPLPILLDLLRYSPLLLVAEKGTILGLTTKTDVLKMLDRR